MSIQILGRSLIGFRDGARTGNVFRAVAPGSGTALAPEFHSATVADTEATVKLAAEAFSVYGNLSGRAKGNFLRTVAMNLEAITDALVERAHQETALPTPRLQGEVARTCGQLRLFADLVEEGSWTAPRIDRALPDRKPLPKPDLRSLLRPIGPVVVFGASNFPLAFSVAGGDTASALAAGNPVVVKAHPAHPGASELAGRAIRTSVQDCGLPEGTFSLLFDSGNRVGAKLVQHPNIKAGAFTGSYAGGRALFDLAMKREEPIPFFAEMASTNPLFILPGALAANTEKIATGLFNSFTLGAGQFCTKPGLVFLPEGTTAEQFAAQLQQKVSASAEVTLLTASIARSFASEAAARDNDPKFQPVARGQSSGNSAAAAVAKLYEANLTNLLEDPHIGSEHFGPSTVLIRFQTKDQILECARRLSGHLTATIHGTPEDLVEYAELVRILENKVGRLIFNGFPTGVEVTHAMVHGGPFPATSDSRTTSVGSLAILRFARPVCYQDFPDSVLPAELQTRNPLGLWRTVDGAITRDALC